MSAASSEYTTPAKESKTKSEAELPGAPVKRRCSDRLFADSLEKRWKEEDEAEATDFQRQLAEWVAKSAQKVEVATQKCKDLKKRLHQAEVELSEASLALANARAKCSGVSELDTIVDYEYSS